MAAYKLIGFLIGSLGILWVSRGVLQEIHQHGFYRFFSWEFIWGLFWINVDAWFVDPFSLRQCFAWFLLIISLGLILSGVHSFRQKGQIDPNRSDPALIGVEKTTKLVTTGIYGCIRHPFYSSLLFLGWGIFLKKLTWIGLSLAILNSVFLFLTAKAEEGENIRYFGDAYQAYMQRTKRFIPWIF